jgi:exopolysaccharide biosynthesis polyprenyl glycosylphosphotransferase
VFSRQSKKSRPFFVVADALLVWLAFEAAYATRSALQLERNFYLVPAVKGFLILVCAVTWLLAGFWVGSYEPILRGRLAQLVASVLRQCLAGTVVLVLAQYVQRVDLSRPFLVLVVVYSFSLLVLFRMAARWLGRRMLGADSARRFLLIVGSGGTALRVGRLIERNRAYGLHLLGFIDDYRGTIRLAEEYPVRQLADLPQLLGAQVVDEVIFAVDPARITQLDDTFLLCEEEGVRTRLHLDVLRHVRGRAEIERLEGEPLLTFAGAPHDDVRLLIKRAVDFLLALLALAVLSPLLLLVAILIRATSPGPVIFRQRRCGLNGRRFTLYKFRTMVLDAEARKASLAHLNVKKTAFKIPNDPRITPIGVWLRKFSLDELPQLWNIVRGEMAIVGPRPPVPEEVERYERWQRRRLRMRPGLTCLWAVSGRDQLEFDDWMRLDLAYIDQWCLMLDLRIILRTIPRVLLGSGAH